MYQNINYSETGIHPKQPIQKQNQRQISLFPQFKKKKPNINRHYPSRIQIATLKNKTEIIIPETK